MRGVTHGVSTFGTNVLRPTPVSERYSAKTRISVVRKGIGVFGVPQTPRRLRKTNPPRDVPNVPFCCAVLRRVAPCCAAQRTCRRRGTNPILSALVLFGRLRPTRVTTAYPAKPAMRGQRAQCARMCPSAVTRVRGSVRPRPRRDRAAGVVEEVGGRVDAEDVVDRLVDVVGGERAVLGVLRRGGRWSRRSGRL